MPPQRDIVPIWSGFIFQGDVALCRALQKINQLGRENILDNYLLRLEEEEDFSIVTENIEIFQVKAYTKHNYTSYRSAWTSMMQKYPEQRANNFLIVQKDDIDFTRFQGVEHENLTGTNILSGNYSLSNIDDLLLAEIETLSESLGIQCNPEDLPSKRTFCSDKISSYVKERHEAKVITPIPLNQIINWITEAPITLTLSLAKYEISKLFLNELARNLGLLNLDIDEEKEMFENLQDCYNEIEQLSNEKLYNLIEKHISPHKLLREAYLRNDFANFIDNNSIQRVIVKAVQEIGSHHKYEVLQFIKNEEDIPETYQLTTDVTEFDLTNSAGRSHLQKHLELIEESWIQDVDYYVTRGHNISKQEIIEHYLVTQAKAPESNDTATKFGLIGVDEMIQKFSP